MGGVTGVLVALQRTGEDRPLPPAAEHVVALLRSWGPGPEHLTGLALAGITLPSRLGPRFVDALVFTRCGVVVIAAHEPGPVEWPGPGDRTGAVVAAARGALAGHEGGRHVTGLVAVVPPAGSRNNGTAPSGSADAVRVAVSQGSGPEVVEHAGDAGRADGSGSLTEAAPAEGSQGGGGSVPVPPASDSETAWQVREPAPGPWRNGAGGERASAEAIRPQQPLQAGPPAVRWPDPQPVPGVAVVLAERRGLRRIIAQHNRWRTVWSADEVLDACYALSLAHLAPPRAALIADGFPARLPMLDRLPQLPAVVPLLPEPPLAAPVMAEDAPVPWSPPGRGQVFPRQRPIRQIPWGLVFVLTVLVAAGVVAAVFVNQIFHGS
ncbi:hypothetical protein [Amycolatopsis mediterranei]|uniref:hypothetical protein n=1 Tax=Amycolatopsis mediterranei TaxID=33910 RepID=UPI001E2A24C1|nr:hypothetical protein [Amycolatopsis mediterranei]UZF71456.1 hypothetical protein ISP_004724 [Amycolatopsis mediterranei]